MQEIWKDIEGYEGLYQVSNLGRVKSLCQNNMKNGSIMKLCFDKYGYNVITLRNKGKKKTYKVHRLVALHFIDNPNNHPQLNHIDEDKTNNASSNLEWCDAKYNTNYGTGIKRRSYKQRFSNRNRKKVLNIDTGEVFISTMEVQRQLGFNNTGISRCCRGKCKTSYGYRWKYVE